MKTQFLMTGVALLGLGGLSFAQTQVGNDILGDGSGDHSGISVGVDDAGEVVAVGATLNNNNGNADAGHVKVYTWDNGTWTQLGSDIDGEAANDQSGWSLSLSGDATTLAVGARLNDGNGTDAGHVRVYEWNGTSWTSKGGDLDGEAAGDEFGQSVSLSNDGDILAVGARFNDGNGADAGHTRVFMWDGTTWVQLGADIDGEAADDASGQSVSLSNDGYTLAIGERRNDGNGNNSGQVRIFEWDGTNWVQKGMDLLGDAAGDQFGWSVALSADGEQLAVGAPNNDNAANNAGRVKVFSWDGSAWVAAGNPVDGDNGSDRFGWSVSMNDSGTVISVGARETTSPVMGPGKVKVYEWDGTDWMQKGSTIVGDQNADEMGFFNAIDADGDVVVTGAYLHSNGGLDNGQAKVFCFESSVDTLPDVMECDEFTLPTLTYGDYYTAAGGGGSMLSPGDIITSSQTVFVFAENYSCSSETNFMVDIQDCASIDEAEKNTISVFPNPVHKQFAIEGATVGENYILINKVGRQVIRGVVSTSHEVIYLSHLAPGSYILHIEGQRHHLIKY